MTTLSQLRPEQFIELMGRREWKQARYEGLRDPAIAMSPVTVVGFLKSPHKCRITPMHQACAHQPPLEFVHWLYDQHRQQHSGETSVLKTRDSLYRRVPLHVALISNAKPEVVHKLIEWEPAACQAKDALGRLPLHYACNHGASAEVVKALLVVFPHAVHDADNNGWLALHVACRSGMPLPIVQDLLKLCPRSIHEVSMKGTTPLLCAQKTRNVDLIAFLQEEASKTPRNTAGTGENQDRDGQGTRAPVRLTAAALTHVARPAPSFHDLPGPTECSVTSIVVHPQFSSWNDAEANCNPNGDSSHEMEEENKTYDSKKRYKYRKQLTTPSEISTLTNSTSNELPNLDGHSKEESLGRVAFQKKSPYIETRQDLVPFLGEKLPV